MTNDALEKIRTILFEMWDPIGINKNKVLSDEYDNYALQLYKLGQEKNIEAILKLLQHVEQDDLQLTPDPERNVRVARSIIEAFG